MAQTLHRSHRGLNDEMRTGKPRTVEDVAVAELITLGYQKVRVRRIL